MMGGAPGAPGAPMPMAPSYPKKEAKKPGVQMKTLHWGKIPDAKIKGTMWDKDVKDDGVKVNASELESLFAAKKAAAPKQKEGGEGGEGGAVKKRDEIVTLVDPKTSQNTAIAISRFKMTPELICECLKAGRICMTDKPGGSGLTVDQISGVLAILPTAEDVEVCQGYDGPKHLLGKAEQFFLAVAGVPRYQIRTKCMLVRVTFSEKYGECEEKIQTVKRAVTQLRKSKAFKQVLEYALACGNYLNGVSNKGAAWGFKIDSLNKLKDTKTADNSSTMLHYIAARLEEKSPAGQVAPALLLGQEVPDLEGATRCIWKDETGELAQLKASLKQVQTQVKLDKITEFTDSMGLFQAEASSKVEALAAVHAETQAAINELKTYYAEDAKTEPEDVFGILHNFAITFEKAHKYNKAEIEKQKKQEKMAAAKAARGAGKGAAQRKNLVDGIADGKGMPGAARRQGQHRPSVSERV